IQRQLAQAQPAPPAPTTPRWYCIFQLGGAEVLNSELLWLTQAHCLPLLVRVLTAGAAASTSSSACVGKLRLATVMADTALKALAASTPGLYSLARIVLDLPAGKAAGVRLPTAMPMAPLACARLAHPPV